MVIKVPRPRWTPETQTDEQERLIEAVRHAANQSEQWERGCYAAIRAAQAAGVPMEYLVKQSGKSQATVYRHINDAAPATDAEPGILAELPPATREAAMRELAAAGWTARDFLLASLTMLVQNPTAYLARLAKVYPRRSRPPKG